MSMSCKFQELRHPLDIVVCAQVPKSPKCHQKVKSGERCSLWGEGVSRKVAETSEGEGLSEPRASEQNAKALSSGPLWFQPPLDPLPLVPGDTWDQVY